MNAPAHDLTHMLARLVDETVPGARSAVLLSKDGLARFWHGLHKDDADLLAAIASGQLSQAQQVSVRFCGGGGVRQVACELANGILLVTAAGENSALAVLAAPTADTGNLSYHMAMLTKQVPEYLATAPRSGGGTVIDPGVRP